MCFLLTATHSCLHKIRFAILCGSTSLACDSTFQSTTKYYACPDCQFNLALALENNASEINYHCRPKASRGLHEDTMDSSISDSRICDFPSPNGLGSVEPEMGWDNLHRTRARREEEEILECTTRGYLANRRALTPRPELLENMIGAPATPADEVPQERRESTGSLSSLRSSVSTSSAFGAHIPQVLDRKPNVRMGPRARDPTLDGSSNSSGDDSDDDNRSPPKCPRHVARPTSYQASQCDECKRVQNGIAIHHLKPADVVEDWTRADMKTKPTWKGWVPVRRVPAGEFHHLPKFDRRGMVVVDDTYAPVTRTRVKRRKISDEETRGGD